MAAPMGRVILLRNSNSSSFVIRHGNVSVRMIPSRSFTLQHISQLRKGVGLRIDLKRVGTSRKFYGLSHVRCASTNIQQAGIPDIPTPPEIPGASVLPDIVPNLPELNALGEPTLKSLGLGSNWPPGLFQKLLEAMHVHADIPWWLAIMGSVFVLRLIIIPVMVKQQRAVAVITKNQPKMKKLQEAIDEAKSSQDALEIMKKNAQLSQFIREKKMSPLQMMLPMAVQFPMFVSAYFGLRKMAELPVESLTEGGALWFTNLTLSDPFYILPVLGFVSLVINFEIGAETGSAQSASHAQRWLMRGSTVIFLYISSLLPASTSLYFAANNFLTLVIARGLRTPAIREKLNIPPLVRPAQGDNKGLIAGFKEMFDKKKQKSDIINWRYKDDEQFKKAGGGPVPKTFRYNPKAVAN